MREDLRQELKAFQLDFERGEGLVMKHLLERDICVSFLKEQMVNWGAPNIVVAASMFSKRYALMVASSSLYTLALHNKAMHLPIHKVSWNSEGKLYLSNSARIVQDLKDQDRTESRYELFYTLFSENITPMIANLQEVSRIKSAILWENIAVRINSIYRKMLARDLDAATIERIYQDFEYLKYADGALFHLNTNPLTSFLKIGIDLEENPLRKTCCLFHQLDKNRPEKKCCLNCPLI
ncbi:ferric iron reductase protein FhuF [Saliterribacillus persicus]|uniref:Ferric iron reductase protein FhuF n=1 Tax=Saliterribacillus persicus TaxID=930114 RepID=A0A368Y9I2_9BACI|nr:ferric iron reductase protein FhuF [Saliterribacillus persicus]